MPKNEENKPAKNRRDVKYMTAEEVKSGKPSKWEKLEISGENLELYKNYILSKIELK